MQKLKIKQFYEQEVPYKRKKKCFKEDIYILEKIIKDINITFFEEAIFQEALNTIITICKRDIDYMFLNSEQVAKNDFNSQFFWNIFEIKLKRFISVFHEECFSLLLLRDKTQSKIEFINSISLSLNKGEKKSKEPIIKASNFYEQAKIDRFLKFLYSIAYTNEKIKRLQIWKMIKIFLENNKMKRKPTKKRI